MELLAFEGSAEGLALLFVSGGSSFFDDLLDVGGGGGRFATKAPYLTLPSHMC